MDPNDQEKTSFVTGQGTYCYQVIPFGLKNVGATYQRLVNKMFQKQIGASMEVYIDDILVKSVKAKLHVAHLTESFQDLKNYNMKLNLTKCAFRVSVEKFLGFIVNSRGIEANPDKIKVVLDMEPPLRENSLPFIWPFQISQLAPPWSESEIEYNSKSITAAEL